ncbi:M55 family metallopeptidase [Pukyongiella litopenaei]|uniref:M55 family metallopeptidase n=1 Tax=Pukyongiella litopenaei TaxID=2605946 RepID=A0A5C2H925_9RHOB|nr:M55 family metallopeptidase [Pukyongiella litopenaei]QEP30299.1 M55 family metallopeptidase [Pukyongiella litopenaei]
MKIKILADTSYRVSSAISQHFSAESTVNIPREAAEKLIAQGVAEAVEKPSEQGA